MVFGIFKSSSRNEKIDQKYAEREYEKCRAHRRQKTEGFRSIAEDYLILNYPASKPIMDARLAPFMAYDQANKCVLIGEFLDKFYPSLDFVGFDDPPEVRLKAATEYKAKIERYEREPFLETDIELDDEQKEFVLKHYFYLKGKLEESYIIGCQISVDKRVVAESTFWTNHPDGYLVKSFMDAVVLGPRQPTGVRSVKISLLAAKDLSRSNTYEFEYLYLDEERFSQNPSFAKRTTQILEFLRAVEPSVSMMPSDMATEINRLAEADDDEQFASVMRRLSF